MFPKEREIGSSSGLGQGEVDSENLSFIKIFQGEDLTSETMRAFPYDFIKNVPQTDFSRNMVIRTQWGLSWEVQVSMNPRFYYMEKRGWNQFVNDNALGANEFVTFTHTGLMCFDVNIYEENGKLVVTPRRPRTMASLSGIKKEEGESSDKDVQTGESTRGAKLKVRSKNSEGAEPSKKKKMIKSNNVEHTDSKFNITIRTSYRNALPIPRRFTKNHIPNESKMVTIHHSNGNSSWKVLCLVNKTRASFSSGWPKLAREYPLSVDDICTVKLIKPTEFHLVVSEKAEEDE